MSKCQDIWDFVILDKNQIGLNIIITSYVCYDDLIFYKRMKRDIYVTIWDYANIVDYVLIC